MSKLDVKKCAQILSCSVEGNSIRATVRMIGAVKNTVSKLLADVGATCVEYQDKMLRNLPCNRLQCDEIWSFVYAYRIPGSRPAAGHLIRPAKLLECRPVARGDQ